MKFSQFLNLSSKIAYLLSYLNIILIACLSCFTFVTNQRKNIPPEMTIQECVYYTIFSVHSLLQYIVSVTYTKFLQMDLTMAFKALNEKQQTASMRLTIIQHDITVIYDTYFQMYYYLIRNIIRVWATKQNKYDALCPF